jgi:hypothetical protein
MHDMRRWTLSVLFLFALSFSAYADDELQSKWRQCSKCAVMFFHGGGVGTSSCPVGVGATHTATATSYLIPLESFTETAQDGWRRCTKCLGLAFAGPGAPSACPKGAKHDHTGSPKYELLENPAPDVKTEGGWKWCDQCGGVFRGAGKCPAVGNHQGPSSGSYFMIDEVAPANAITVRDDVGLAFDGGEVQSTVVPPGVHDDCQGGRIIISSDANIARTGSIRYRDLHDPAAPLLEATIAEAPGASDESVFKYGSADHDIVTRPNGDVLLIVAAFSKAPVSTKPAWFDQTYRWGFGPGARSVMMTWRSTNCGKTFEYAPELLYDSAVEAGGWCGTPQFPRTFFHADNATQYNVPVATPALSGDENWRYCAKCQGLFDVAAASPICPVGGVHDPVLSAQYELVTTDLPGATDDDGWKRCKNCSLLYSSEDATSRCGAGHEPGKNYVAITGDANAPNLLTGWRACSRCGSLYHPATSASDCSNGGEHQDGGAYQVALQSNALSGETGWRVCTKCRTLFSSTQAQNVCPSGGPHAAGGTKLELLTSSQNGLPTEAGWNACKRCGALFRNVAGATHCPAARLHDGSSSPNFHLATGALPPGMHGDWKHCSKCGALHSLFLGPQGCPVAAANELPKYDMGGTDGPLVAVDRAADRVFLSHRCVGWLHDQKVTTFELTPRGINRTLIGRLQKHDKNWSTVGVLNQNLWRTSLVPLQNETLVAGLNSWIFPGFKLPGAYFFADGIEVSGGAFGWDGWTDASKPATIGTNIWEHSIIGRTPGTNSVFVVHGESKPNRGHGYRLTFVADGTFTEFPQVATLTEASEHMILPMAGNAGDFILHLQAVDPGAGPVLLYWLDVNTATNQITVRGRFITGPNEFTKDFTISQSNGTARSFAATPTKWYGDYHTAGGWAGPLKYIYKPLWVEPDGVHYGHVEIVKHVLGFSPPTPSILATNAKRARATARPVVRPTRDEAEYSERQRRTRVPRERKRP